MLILICKTLCNILFFIVLKSINHFRSFSLPKSIFSIYNFFFGRNVFLNQQTSGTNDTEMNKILNVAKEENKYWIWISVGLALVVVCSIPVFVWALFFRKKGNHLKIDFIS